MHDACSSTSWAQVAPHASHLLRRVLSHHAAMKLVVAKEVQQLLHRPKLQARGLYNGITFLDQASSHASRVTHEWSIATPTSRARQALRLELTVDNAAGVGVRCGSSS